MDTLDVLRDMRDDHNEKLQHHIGSRDVWCEGTPNYVRHDSQVCETEESIAALEQAIAIITEADTLLPVLQQMAHSLALGEAGDAALKRLIVLLSTEEVHRS